VSVVSFGVNDSAVFSITTTAKQRERATIQFWDTTGFDVYVWDQCYAMEQSLRID
jgi:hypothetical protein